MSKVIELGLFTEPAVSISRVRRTAGQRLHFDVLTGIQLPGKRPVGFRSMEYDELVTGAQGSWRTFLFKEDVANRLLGFVRTCYIQRQFEYGSYTFVEYLLGTSDSPLATKESKAKLRTYFGIRTSSDKIRLGRPYALLDRHEQPIIAFFGLGPELALAVLGSNATIGICPVTSLMRVYGASHIDVLAAIR